MVGQGISTMGRMDGWWFGSQGIRPSGGIFFIDSATESFPLSRESNSTLRSAAEAHFMRHALSASFISWV